MNPEQLLPRIISAVCPDDEYREWAEPGDAAVDRAARYILTDGKVSKRADADPLAFGLWGREVQKAWVVAKDRMGKYEACASCREYDAHELLSPATLALRLPENRQPVQEDLRRQISGAIEARERVVPPQVARERIEKQAETEGDEPPRVAPKALIDRFRRKPPRRSYVGLAAKIGIGKDTMYAITGELRWVSDEMYELVAEVCGCKPEDLHPRVLPRPERRR